MDLPHADGAVLGARADQFVVGRQTATPHLLILYAPIITVSS